MKYTGSRDEAPPPPLRYLGTGPDARENSQQCRCPHAARELDILQPGAAGLALGPVVHAGERDVLLRDVDVHRVPGPAGVRVPGPGGLAAR